MHKKPNLALYSGLTLTIIILIFLLTNAQSHNGNPFVFDANIGTVGILKKIFADGGHFMAIILTSALLIYRQQYAWVYKQKKNVGSLFWVFGFTFFSSALFFVIITTTLDGHAQGLAAVGMLAFFIFTLIWYLLLEVLFHFLFKRLTRDA